MRYLFIIPALFLFLSNIPFIQEMKMNDMQEMSAGDGCCKKNGNMEGACHKPKTSPVQSKNDHCPEPKTENSCVCICCFQYTAPEQQLVKFGSIAIPVQLSYNLLIDRHWLDPLLAGPWQPPDLT